MTTVAAKQPKTKKVVKPAPEAMSAPEATVTKSYAREKRCIQDLRLVMTNLIELIDTENKALSGHDFNTVKALSANKWTLTRNYRNQMQAIADTPDILQILEDDEQSTLRSLGERLNSASQYNGRLLSANIEAANRVMNAVVQGVKAANERNAIYGKSGALREQTPDGRPVAVSYNKEL